MVRRRLQIDRIETLSSARWPMEEEIEIFQFEFQLHTFPSRAHGACLEFLDRVFRWREAPVWCRGEQSEGTSTAIDTSERS
jgi:hypothetical protein